MANFTMKSMLLGALTLLGSFGCGKEPHDAALVDEDVAVPAPVDGRPALSIDKRRVLEAARATLDVELFERSALLDAEVRFRGRHAFEATLRYRVPIEPGGAGRLVFRVPVDDTSPWVRLTRLEVDGAPVSADGTASRWEVAVVSPAGGAVSPSAAVPRVAEVTLHVAGELPSFASRRQKQALERELDALPALAKLVPDVPQVELGAASGASERLAILMLPMLAERPTIHELTVHAEGATVSATGLRIDGNEGKDGGDTARFAGAGYGQAVVLVDSAMSGEVVRTAIHGRELTVVPGVGEDGAEVVRWVRRSLETLEDRLGRLEDSAWGVVESAELDGLGVVSLPGLLVLPSPPKSGGAGPGIAGGDDWSVRLDAVLAHHPGPREAFERAVAAGVARQFWLGWGEGPLSRIVEHGFAADGALRVVRAGGGDKAGRRALELGWRFPYQLGRMRGAPDPALLTTDITDPTLARVAQAKAGLAFEALSRALGDEPWSAVERALLEARRRGVELTEALVRDTIARHAPRPEQALAHWARWTAERRGDTDVGELRPEVLLEYLVSDGLVSGLSSALLDDAGSLAASPLGQKALAKLGRGEALDTGFGVAMLGELLGPSLDPTSRRWLELGTGLFSKDSRRDALRGLIEELSGELGVPDADRSRLGMLGDLVLDALDAPSPEPSEAPAP